MGDAVYVEFQWVHHSQVLIALYEQRPSLNVVPGLIVRLFEHYSDCLEVV